MRWFEATGTLKYSNDWLILDCGRSIGMYYNWWVQRLIWKKATTPLHGFHVTVVAGKYTKVSNHVNWGKYQNTKIRYEYSNKIEFEKQKDGTYYWLPIRCEALKRIRVELGLDPFPKWPYHLTVAYVNY